MLAAYIIIAFNAKPEKGASEDARTLFEQLCCWAYLCMSFTSAQVCTPCSVPLCTPPVSMAARARCCYPGSSPCGWHYLWWRHVAAAGRHHPASQGTPCPWRAASPALDSSTAQVGSLTRCIFNAALQSLSTHLPACGAGLALAALPMPLHLGLLLGGPAGEGCSTTGMPNLALGLLPAGMTSRP
ncbi:hypothetical protein HaLaN_24014 [Haematococcus lacustris]|uniref:Uncharacterized protein n=1 Tax=Haematococcus lacustris TaxID=44745 RepID=A0A699ZT04_HAELA|nr:hypothetical protein HaLaN_24014 [Haematococcus lacustris]